MGNSFESINGFQLTRNHDFCYTDKDSGKKRCCVCGKWAHDQINRTSCKRNWMNWSRNLAHAED